MPTYLYECTECKNEEELFCSISSKPTTISCSKCKSPARSVIQATTFVMGDGACAANNYSSDANFGFEERKSRKKKR